MQPSSSNSSRSGSGRVNGRKKRVAAVAAVVTMAAGTAVARRRGYQIGGNTVVRCRQGHVFTTVWIPGVSFKALRLGWWRFQRCPVGSHWSLVAPVRDADLTDWERRL